MSMTGNVQETDEVFHYTNISGLTGIISSNSIHASHIDFLNDRREMSHGSDLVIPSISKEFNAIYTNLKKEYLLPDSFDAEISSDQDAVRLMNSIRVTSNRISPIFVASFSRAPAGLVANHGLLSQWRGYGSDGGIALVFDRIELDRLAHSEVEKFSVLTVSSGDCIYRQDDPEYKELLPHLDKFRRAVPIFAKSSLKNRGFDVDINQESIEISELYEPFTNVLPRLKHWAFEEEGEYRIALSTSRGEMTTAMKNPAKIIRFKSRGNYLVPYIEIGSADNHPLPISRVIIGPSPEPQRRIDSVGMLMAEAGYSVDVTLSEIPFS